MLPALVSLVGAGCGIGLMASPPRDDGHDSSVDGDADTDVDADADADADSDADGDTDSDGDPPPDDCTEECAAGQYTTCTCRTDDPCGWIGDGYCDSTCDSILPGSRFDDSADCAAPPPVCGGDCDASRFTSCSCRVDDPCGWAGNGRCDEECNAYGSHYDDSSDCGPPPGDLTYAVTAVYDGLDQNDMDIAANGLERAGYRGVVNDRNVSVGTLAGYLRQDINTLYHTGHGLEGGVMTSDSMLTTDTTRISVRNTVFATCLTLQVSWAGAFGPTAETVSGYTEVSFDYIDNDAAEAWASHLASGRSHAQAWYLANSAIGMLSDRWATYAREGGSIVEYSARTGRRPAALAPEAFVELGRAGGVFIAHEVLTDERSFDRVFERVSLLGPADLEGSFEGDRFASLGPMTATIEDAIDVAEAWLDARDSMPADAVLERVIPIERRTSPDAAPVTVGLAVRFIREVDGIRVRGNLVEDHLTVLVAPTGVVAWSRFWPDVAIDASEDVAPWRGHLLGVGTAALLVSDALSRARKTAEVHVFDARPVYGTLGLHAGDGELVPAFELLTTEGGSIIVNALTGEILL